MGSLGISIQMGHQASFTASALQTHRKTHLSNNPGEDAKCTGRGLPGQGDVTSYAGRGLIHKVNNLITNIIGVCK